MDETRISAENSGRNGALSFPQAAFGFMSRLASGIFSRGQKHVDPLNSDARDDQVQEITNSVNIDHGNESGTQQPNGTTNDCDIVIPHEDVEEHVETKETDLLEVSEALCSLKPKESDAVSSDADASTFKRFDIVKDPYDHYYIGANGQVVFLLVLGFSSNFCKLIYSNFTLYSIMFVDTRSLYSDF